MKKLMLTLTMFLASLAVNAQQGVITVESLKGEVPLNQWYVYRDKDFNDQEFFYAETAIAQGELESILKTYDQSFDFPKGIDEDGDIYWIILRENEHILYIYFSKDDEEYSLITIVTK